jgi:predicted kinase
VEVEAEGYLVAHAIAEDNLRLGRVVVADCVDPWPLTRDAWHAVAARAGTNVIDVEVVCSNIDEHRRRAETRVADIQGHRVPTWAEVLERDYRPWTTDRLVLDTARLTVEESVKAILDAGAQ